MRAVPSTQGKKWFFLMMLMLAHAINDGFAWIIPPLLPAIREHFQLSYSEMGAFYTFFRFFGNILQWPAAYLIHFAPISTILVGGLLWLSIGMFVLSLSSTYGMMVLFSAVGGIGGATYHPLAVTILSRVFGRDSLGTASYLLIMLESLVNPLSIMRNQFFKTPILHKYLVQEVGSGVRVKKIILTISFAFVIL